MKGHVQGYWHKSKRRCDYCRAARDNVYVVRDGPTTGIFCSKQHYMAARDRMENGVDIANTTEEELIYGK